MRPFKIFLVFLIILVIISLLAYFYPNKGIPLGSQYTLTFPSLKEIVQKEEVQYKDISQIVRNNTPVDTSINYMWDNEKDSTLLTRSKAEQVDSVEQKPTDTIQPQPTPKPHKPDYKRGLEYPNGDPSVLYPFFESLQTVQASDNLLRILHYGDSQIEGDRISSYLRSRLQSRFGGTGIGLFPAVLPFNTNISLKHRSSKEWNRYTVQSMKNSNFNHKRFGLLLSFCRYSPLYSNYQDEVYEASITLRESPIAFDRFYDFSDCKIFYGYNEKPFIVKIGDKEQVFDAEMIPPTRKLKTIEWEVPPEPEELTLTFQGMHSPDIYGIALDGESGIALDNIPLRGSSGTDFTKTDPTFYKEMFDHLNVKLILLHFGVNIVPMIREDYSFYENQLYQQLQFLKSLDSNLSVIVMGVTDMSRKVGGHYESYPNIEKIRNAQKRAAFKANCVFWDTLEAMGGKNSMPSWVFADPPLARKDFTHFTYKGSVVIAKMFYKALMNDYQKYHQSKNPKIETSQKDSL